ncbi:protein SIX6OS1 isoform X2 [Mixophyes fleayi]
MNREDFSDFDKLLLELVFQNEQESQNKENTKEVIQDYSAKTLHEKQQIFALQKDIGLSEETILDLQKYLAQPSQLSLLCTPTCTLFSREEAFLQSQLDSAINTSENDKKTYQDSVNKYKEILKQHQEKYMEFTLAKKYHSLKQELDDIQNVILKYDIQWKRKDKRILDILEPTSFASYIDWSLRLATLRKNTNETLEQISQISRTTSEMIPKVHELEQKIKYISEHTKEIPESENYNKPKRKTVEFQQRIFSEGKTGLSQSIQNRSQQFHLPDLPQKLVRSPRDARLPSNFNEIDREGKENVGIPNNCSSVFLRQDQCVEKDKQESFYDGNKDHAPSTTHLHPKLQLRFVLPQKQTNPKLDAKETDIRKEQITDVPDTSKDSGYVSQIYSGSSEEMECKTYAEVSTTEVFALPSIPSSFAIPDTPSTTASTSVRKSEISKGRKGQNFKKSSMNLYLSPMEQTEKSPCFNFFKTSTPKTHNCGSFESTFGSINFQDQQSSFSGVDLNTASPVKDIGSIFGKMEGDNEFAFTFASKHSQASDDERDDFGFMLPFGEDLKTPKDFAFKESEPSQSKMKFTFF